MCKDFTLVALDFISSNLTTEPEDMKIVEGMKELLFTEVHFVATLCRHLVGRDVMTRKSTGKVQNHFEKEFLKSCVQVISNLVHLSKFNQVQIHFSPIDLTIANAVIQH